MSERKTNVEMDDVLSSIRELVSETVAAKPDPHPPADRLVLTPALMVVEGSAHLRKPAAPQAQGNPQDGIAPDQSEESGADAPISAEFIAMEQAWQEELRRMKARREGKAAGENTREQAHVSLEERIAELEAAVGQAEDEWEPDGSEPDAFRPLRHRLFEVIENPKPPQPAARSSVEKPKEPPVARPDPAPQPEPQSEPVFSHSDAPFFLSRNLQAPADPASANRSLPAPETAGEKGGELVEDDDVYLDLDALRDMISDVVREELRGRLGETITRNVRRMVRLEIDRAIARYDPED